MQRDLEIEGLPIGLRFLPGEDPERSGVTLDLVNRYLDPMAGHGTFVAGVIRQHCPTAELLSVPVMYGDGACDEYDLVRALQRLYVWHLAARRGHVKGRPLDVISLSLGYYHETPGSVVDEGALFSVLRAFGEAGVAVVAAAGNGATDVEFWPGALAGRAATGVPVTCVGATNPGGGVVSLFSNTGTWVSCYHHGAAVVSTMPTTFDASQRGGIFVPEDAYPARGSSDRDAFDGGFGVWSGTSFSAPSCAGRIAAQLARTPRAEDAADAVARGTKAVAAVVKESRRFVTPPGGSR